MSSTITVNTLYDIAQVGTSTGMNSKLQALENDNAYCFKVVEPDELDDSDLNLFNTLANGEQRTTQETNTTYIFRSTLPALPDITLSTSPYDAISYTGTPLSRFSPALLRAPSFDLVHAKHRKDVQREHTITGCAFCRSHDAQKRSIRLARRQQSKQSTPSKLPYRRARHDWTSHHQLNIRLPWSLSPGSFMQSFAHKLALETPLDTSLVMSLFLIVFGIVAMFFIMFTILGMSALLLLLPH